MDAAKHEDSHPKSKVHDPSDISDMIKDKTPPQQTYLDDKTTMEIEKEKIK